MGRFFGASGSDFLRFGVQIFTGRVLKNDKPKIKLQKKITRILNKKEFFRVFK